MAQQTTADERTDALNTELRTASDERLARLLANVAATTDSEDTQLALTSMRACSALATELKERGREDLARRTLEGDA